MATPPTVFARKQVYHSELKAKSPVPVRLTGPVRESRYPGRLPYCRFRVEGSEQEHELQIENSAVRGVLEAIPTHQLVTVAAAGSRETAVLHLVSGGDPLAAAAAGAPVEGEAGEDTSQASASAAAEASLARTYFDALSVAEKLVTAFQRQHGRAPTKTERIIATSLWIEMNRSGGRVPLTRRGGEG